MTPVYRFTIYDIASDTERESGRWATRAAIARVRGTIVSASELLIDEVLLGGEVEGMTDRNFNPDPRGGTRS